MPSRVWHLKTTRLRTAMLFVVVALVGCSGSDVGEVAELSGTQSFASTALTPVSTVISEPNAEINSSPTAPNPVIEPFRNPFAPPKDPPPPPFVEEPKLAPPPEPLAEPEPVREFQPTTGVRPVTTAPQVRLLGFMNIGEPKVLVSFRDELKTLAIGDMLEEMKVVKIESPELTMLFDERDIMLSLFDQTWQHEGRGSPANNNNRGQTRPRPTRPAPSTSSTPSPSPPRTAPDAGGIPGFGPSDGQGPGFQRLGSSGSGSNPGSPLGRGLPGIPGLGGGAGRDAIPGLPGAGTEVTLPGLPGAL